MTLDVAMSLISFLLILLGSIVVNYALSMVIEKIPASSKMVKVIGVVFNLALLFYFKYLGFFMDNVSAITGTDHFYYIISPYYIGNVVDEFLKSSEDMRYPYSEKNELTIRSKSSIRS